MRIPGSVLRQVAKSRLARQTGWVFAAQGGRIALQAAYFVLLARTLEAGGYGTLEATLSIVFILTPFASWGAGQLLVMRVARDASSFPRYWGNALLITAITTIPLTLLAVVVALWLVPDVPIRLPLALALAQFLFARIADGAAQAFQAFERMRAVAVLNILPGISRLAAAILFVTASRSQTPESWGILYLVSTALSTGLCVGVVSRLLGRPSFDLTLIRGTVRVGGGFSLGAAADFIYADIDKTLLARLATVEDAGLYAAAYRATFMAFTPVRSLLYASYARFFQVGEQGIAQTRALARRLLPYTLGLGVAAGVGLWVCAPLAPVVLGNDFRSSVTAIRWLAPLPLLQAVDYLAGDTLTGANHQGIRTALQMFAIPLNVGLNLLLIPHHSWRGAAWATLATEGSLAIGLSTAVWAVSRARSAAAAP